ncbi:hypothetical protein CALCODRAFT_522145 [Calocera cornea HHB12733]|uniref:DUF6532 domain-containing protein n=1 Tax=Calocera cornea HHB12733 TaxID=1353952 RepID=A0A166MPN0_9BASI|nr:hypothetical protein CALCODRAFT_522145 [Calocera cornea HHB12733]
MDQLFSTSKKPTRSVLTVHRILSTPSGASVVKEPKHLSKKRKVESNSEVEGDDTTPCNQHSEDDISSPKTDPRMKKTNAFDWSLVAAADERNERASEVAVSYARMYGLIVDFFADREIIAALGLNEAERARCGHGPSTIAFALADFPELAEDIDQELTEVLHIVKNAAANAMVSQWPNLFTVAIASSANYSNIADKQSWLSDIQLFLQDDQFLHDSFDPRYPTLASPIPFSSDLLSAVMSKVAFDRNDSRTSARVWPNLFSPIPISFVAFISAVIRSMLEDYEKLQPLRVTGDGDRTYLQELYRLYYSKMQDFKKDDTDRVTHLLKRITDRCFAHGKISPSQLPQEPNSFAARVRSVIE